ncbi:MAG: hypothetical protein HY560_00170, partial [Gemmatimonadetes bacterium]|nr:hypothetical protein [Gemmatimonadota bacterium]
MRRLSLRTQFLLVLVLGAILPLGLLGLWLSRSAERSAQALVRERLDRDLSQVVEEVGLRWVRYRSDFLALAEQPRVQRLLRAPGGASGRPPTELLPALSPAVADVADAVIVRDSAGVERGRFVVPPERASPAQRVIGSVVPVSLDLYDNRSGARVGALEAQVRVSALLPAGAGWVGVGGAVLALFDRTSGAPLLPLSIEPARFRQPRFAWADESWLTRGQVLSEPPLDIVLAAPLGPVTGPFAGVARQGTVALVAVVLGAILLVSAVTGGLTVSLSRLATSA